jgi:hypothetical protein
MRFVRQWSKKETAKAIELFDKNYSSAKIATIMNEEGWRSDCPKITRNSIIGLLHRNNRMRDKTIKLIRELKPVEPIVEIDIEELSTNVEVEEAVELDDRLTSIVNLEYNECRYATGDIKEEDLRFCGKEIDFSLNRSYCRHHYKLCYFPARR